MDHVDWLDVKAARELSNALAKHVAPGGRVIWRSAALCPPYARLIREAGFEVLLPHLYRKELAIS
jgi:betaine lipid synthase